MKIFISYSHRDEAACEAFRTALAPLIRLNGVEHWFDGKIPAGGRIDDHITQALNHADVVALLISVNFFASDYCYQTELQRALERREEEGCVVVPVIIDHVEGWQDAAFAKFKVLPKDGKPVTAFGRESEGWASVIKGIRELTKAQTPKPGAACCRLPIPRNPLFTGRAADLQWIADTLATGRPAALLHGMGGVGKTQTAAEFARRHADTYQVAWWVTAETATEADAGYDALAVALQLPDRVPDNAEKTRQAVTAWMERQDGWLVVLDNAESPKDLAPWLPKAPKGHLLITSRNPNWGLRAAVHDINVWPLKEAAEFLMQRSGDTDQTAAEKLAQALGCLPLACETAAAYVHETGGSLARFADLLAQRPVKLLDFLPEDTVYARTLPQVIDMAVEAVGRESPLALVILRTLAWLAPDNIPRWLLDAWPDDALEIDAALAVLLRRALLRRTGDGFAVHRLTQQIIRATDPQADDSAAVAIRALNETFIGNPQYDVQHWPRYAALLPHGEALFALLPEPPPELRAASRICNKLGLFLQHAKGDYPAAKLWFQGSLAALTKAWGGLDNPEFAIRSLNPGGLLRVMGDLTGAKPLYQRALAITEQALGPDHPDVASVLTGLGKVLEQSGELSDARTHHEKALKMRERHFGPDHPLVATALNNLALALQKLGDQAAARRHFERALEINLNHPERGPSHPETALRHHNLGAHLFEQGDTAAAAELHFASALEIYEKHLAPQHPHITNARKWLAIVRQALGKQ